MTDQRELLNVLNSIQEEIKNSRTFWNSDEFNDLQKGLKKEIREMSKILKNPDATIPEEDFLKRMEHIYNLSDSYVLHKDRRGVKDNSKDKLQSVKKLRRAAGDVLLRWNIDRMADATVLAFDMEKEPEEVAYMRNVSEKYTAGINRYLAPTDGYRHYDIEELNHNLGLMADARKELMIQAGKEIEKVREDLQKQIPAADENEKELHDALAIPFVNAGSKAWMHYDHMSQSFVGLDIVNAFTKIDLDGHEVSLGRYVNEMSKRYLDQPPVGISDEERRYWELGCKASSAMMDPDRGEAEVILSDGNVTTHEMTPQEMAFFHQYRDKNMDLRKRELFAKHGEGMKAEGIRQAYKAGRMSYAELTASEGKQKEKAGSEIRRSGSFRMNSAKQTERSFGM